VGWKTYRTIVEEADVTTALQAYRKKLTKFDEAWIALTWLLARKADDLGSYRVESGKLFRLYAQAGDFHAKTPRIVVLYSVSDTEVIIHGVRASAVPKPKKEDP
jgi:hypothetical protein